MGVIRRAGEGAAAVLLLGLLLPLLLVTASMAVLGVSVELLLARVRRWWDEDALTRHVPFALHHHDGTIRLVCAAGHHAGPVEWPCARLQLARRRLYPDLSPDRPGTAPRPEEQ